MARGKKSYTLEEQLQMTTNDIEKYEEAIKVLKAKKKELEKAIKQEKLAQLYEIVQASGKTIDEVKEMLSAK